MGVDVVHIIIAAFLGLLIMASALGVVFLKNPVHSALSLLANLCITAIMYVALLSAPFVAIVQVIVYMGAVVVFVLFVIMLMDIRATDITERFLTPRLVFSLAAVVVFALQMLFVVATVKGRWLPTKYVHAGDLAKLLFTKYALLFELVSVLIFAAAAGAVALAKKRI